MVASGAAGYVKSELLKSVAAHTAAGYPLEYWHYVVHVKVANFTLTTLLPTVNFKLRKEYTKTSDMVKDLN